MIQDAQLPQLYLIYGSERKSGGGMVSIVLALAGVTSLAGWVYLVMFPLTWVVGRRTALQPRSLENDLTPLPADE